MYYSIAFAYSLLQVTILAIENLLLNVKVCCWYFYRFNWDMSIDEAVELARRAIYHATFRDGASGGVVSGK
jgi:hypothetical protein